MTVPSVRQVARRRVTWWDADRAGAPLTPALAYWLRRRTHGGIPLGVVKGLARRGLHAGLYVGQARLGLTPEGEALRVVLGSVPERFWSTIRSPSGAPRAPSEASVACPSCGRMTNVELIAWGASGACLACALPGEEGTK